MEKTFFFKSHTEDFLHLYLLENGITESEFQNLSESVKNETVLDLIKTLVAELSERLDGLDTTLPDKSKGDIKSLKNLQSIQQAITQLEAMLDRADSPIRDAREYVGIIIKSIMYLNQYADVFKNAYRNKKTLLIMKYQSVVLAIISSVAYLISALVDFSNNEVRLYKDPRLEEIAPITSLMNFNKSIETGEFKIITKDVTIVREYFTEVPVETMSRLLEAQEILPMIIDGIKAFTDNMDTAKVANILYKATGVVLLLISVREVIYTLSRAGAKINELVSNIDSFANINLGGSLGALSNFAKNFKVKVEAGSEMAEREIRDEDRGIASDIRHIQNTKQDEPEVIDATPVASTTEFDFDF